MAYGELDYFDYCILGEPQREGYCFNVPFPIDEKEYVAGVGPEFFEEHAANRRTRVQCGKKSLSASWDKR